MIWRRAPPPRRSPWWWPMVWRLAMRRVTPRIRKTLRLERVQVMQVMRVTMASGDRIEEREAAIARRTPCQSASGMMIPAVME